MYKKSILNNQSIVEEMNLWVLSHDDFSLKIITNYVLKQQPENSYYSNIFVN